MHWSISVPGGPVANCIFCGLGQRVARHAPVATSCHPFRLTSKMARHVILNGRLVRVPSPNPCLVSEHAESCR